MQDMFENAKRIANTAVERAAWEADKLRRTNVRQRDIDLALRERSTLLDQLGSIVLDLDKRGQLTSEPLKAVAQRLRTLESEVTKAQDDLRAIRAEQFIPGTISINVSRAGSAGSGHTHADADETDACPTCGQPVRRTAAFCSACGARLR